MHKIFLAICAHKNKLWSLSSFPRVRALPSSFSPHCARVPRINGSGGVSLNLPAPARAYARACGRVGVRASEGRMQCVRLCVQCARVDHAREASLGLELPQCGSASEAASPSLSDGPALRARDQA